MMAYDLNEALNAAQNMENFFRAFQRLNEFLQFVAQSEQRVAELSTQETEIKARIEKFIDEQTTYRKEFTQFVNENEQIKQELTQAIEQLKQDRATCQTQIREAQRQCEALTRQYMNLGDLYAATKGRDEAKLQDVRLEYATADNQRRAAIQEVKQLQIEAADLETAHENRKQVMQSEIDDLAVQKTQLEQVIISIRETALKVGQHFDS